MRQLWAPWRMEYLDSTAEPGCFICNAAADPAHAHVIDRDESALTMLNKFPYNSGHAMVAPLRHVETLAELSDDESLAVLGAVNRTTLAMKHAMNPDGFNIGINQGRAAGGSVDHLHIHVVPRWGGDTNYMPVLGETKVMPEFLEKTAAKLRESIAAVREQR